MKVLDLFSGVGGMSLGLGRAGMDTVAFCEIDKACRRVLNSVHPDVPVYHDVSKLTAKVLVDDGIPFPDVISGGFPCQDISFAWDGRGLEGKRSGLWFEYARLVRELLPQYVIIENVANLVARGLSAIEDSLTEIGYEVHSLEISASDVGAPHERRRVWIIAYRAWSPVVHASDCGVCEGCEDRICYRCRVHMADCPCPGPHSDENEWGLQETNVGLVAYPHRSGRGEQRRPRPIQAQHLTHECRRWRTIEPPVLRVDDGFPGRVDSVKQMGNAVVPLIPEQLGRLILAHHRTTNGTI